MLAWHQLMHNGMLVFNLTQKHCQSKDLRFAETLLCIRIGQPMEEDFKLLETWLINKEN
jgi:hypothetical protein